MRRFTRATTALALLLGVGAATPSPASGVSGFGDVEPERFYTDAVQWMVDNEITTGTTRTCFSPDDEVTRGQAAAFLWRMENEPQAPAHFYADVSADWQQGPVSWMAASGITTGTSPTTYEPDRVLTRGEMAALLHRLAGNPAVIEMHPFTDVTRSWQQEPVSWLHASEITTGTSATTFSPDDPVSRAQLATFLHRYEDEPPVVVDSEHPAYPWCDDPVARPDLGGDGWGCDVVDPQPSPTTWECAADLDGDATAESWTCTFTALAGDPIVCAGDVDSSPDTETWECQPDDSAFEWDVAGCTGDIDDEPGDENWSCAWQYNVDFDPSYPENAILIGCGGDTTNSSGDGSWGCLSFDGQIDCSGDIAGGSEDEHWSCRTASGCVGDQRAALLNLPMFLAVETS